MKVLFTCGGTAGHINPGLALANMFRQRDGAEVLFVGAKGGMEEELVPREGFPIRTVNISSFYRSMSLNGIRHNAKTAVNLVRSRGEAKGILDEFRPDLVVGTGGYASYPVVRAAARRHIPTAVHESNAFPGLTTKMLAKWVDVVMVGFAESREHYPDPSRVIVTGTPVRGDFFDNTKRQARALLGIQDDRPVVLTTWGSLGALKMNQHMVDFILREIRDGQPFHHIYGAGQRYYDGVRSELQRRGIQLRDYPRVDMREYIYDMPVCMAAADVVLSRAGASTIAEISEIAKPSILVPSPNVTANHQEKNARVLSDHGAAVLMPEPECSGDKLYEQVMKMAFDPAGLEEMSRKLASIAVVDANERIYDTLKGLLH